MKRILAVLALCLLLVGVAGATNTSAYDSYVVLLLHGNGTPFIDSSQYNATITNTGTVTADTGVKMLGSASARFSRSNYLSAPDSTSWTFGTGDWTIMFHVNATTASTTYFPFGQLNSDVSAGSVYGGVKADNHYRGVVFSGGSANVIDSEHAFTTTQWNQYVLTRNGGTVYLYINGAQEGTFNIGSAAVDDVSNAFIVGKAGNNNYGAFVGTIDEFVVWKGVSVPISALYPLTYEVGVNVNVTPVASFSQSVNTGTAPISISFADTSTNTPTSWEWDFGDGNTTGNTLQNTTHLYTTTGNYSVSLTVTNTAGSDTAYSSVRTYDNRGKIWYQLNSSVPARYGGIGYVLDDGTIIIAGGTNSTHPTTEVLRSDDNGQTWYYATRDAAFGWRQFPGGWINNGVMYIGGGVDGTIASQAVNSIYSSTDGATWTLVNASPSWPARHAPLTWVRNGKLYISGGMSTSASHINDLWSSTDGNIWTQESNPAYGAREYSGTAVVDNTTVYVIGGYGLGYLNDAWVSSDGVSFTQKNASSGFGVRYGQPSITSSDNRVWVIAGTDNSVLYNDIWWTDDGVTWHVANTSAAFDQLKYPELITQGNKSFLYGGTNFDKTNFTSIWISSVAPISRATANATSILEGEYIAFTDTSISSPTSWYWEFGDGSSSSLQNPLHQYSTEGDYTVSLTVSNEYGSDKVSYKNYIDVTSSTTITADFTASNSSGIQPLLVQFTDTSTTTDATIDSWAWDFGDGNTSTSQSPSHLYDVPGTHTANLTITNTSYSLVSTKLVTITVYKQPVCDFSSFNTVGTAPFTTRLFDTSTNLNTGPYTYYTDFGDGNTSTEEALYYNWNITGTYDVKHCITDSVTTACNNKTAYVTVGSPETAPVASFYGGPQLGAPPLQVFFTDVSTNTPTGWNWSHGDGTYSIIQNPTHWYNKSGFYTVGLTASNGAGSNTSTQTNFVMVY